MRHSGYELQISIGSAARTANEACALVEAGFDYVTDIDDVKIFRKRKDSPQE